MTELSIGVVCYIKNNEQAQIEFTKRCVNSIRKFVKKDHNLIIVDNGSSDVGFEAVKQMNPEYLIRMPINTGVSNAYNIVVEVSRTKYIYIPNNDHMVCENSIENMIEYLETNTEDVKVVGSPESQFITTGLDFNWQPVGADNMNTMFQQTDIDAWNETAQKFINKHKGNAMITSPGSNFLMTRETWKNFGKFRISFNHGWNALDNYIYEDTRDKNIKMATCLSSVIYHPYGGQGTSKYTSPQIPEESLDFLRKTNANIRG